MPDLQTRWIVSVFLVAAVLNSAQRLRADEPKMQVFIEDRLVIFAGVTESIAKELAKTNGFDDPLKWPVYKTTGLPSFHYPEGFKKLTKTHPKWKLDQIEDFRVSGKAFKDDKKTERDTVRLFYNADVNVFFIFFEKIEFLDLEKSEK